MNTFQNIFKIASRSEILFTIFPYCNFLFLQFRLIAMNWRAYRDLQLDQLYRTRSENVISEFKCVLDVLRLFT